MGALISKCAGTAANNPDKLAKVITASFNSFDKDKSGYVEGPEVKAMLEKVLQMGNITGIDPNKVDAVFNKVSGPDQKLDKEEFSQLVNQVLAKTPAPGTAAA